MRRRSMFLAAVLSALVSMNAKANPPVMVGKILLIKPNLGSAWINLGTADNLRMRMKLQVMRQDDDEAVIGKVEVVRIWWPKFAEVRILESDAKTPMKKGDLIVP